MMIAVRMKGLADPIGYLFNKSGSEIEVFSADIDFRLVYR
jgi:hypothetical protein